MASNGIKQTGRGRKLRFFLNKNELATSFWQLRQAKKFLSLSAPPRHTFWHHNNLQFYLSSHFTLLLLPSLTRIFTPSCHFTVPASQIPTSLLLPGNPNLSATPHAVEHVSQQMSDVLSARWLQLEGEVLSVVTSPDVRLAGSTFVPCSCSGSADVW